MRTYFVVPRGRREGINQLMKKAGVCAEEMKHKTRKHKPADVYFVDFSTLNQLPPEARLAIMLVEKAIFNKEQKKQIVKAVTNKRAVMVMEENDAVQSIQELFMPKALHNCAGIVV